MNQQTTVKASSTCPHDCPSTCALSIDVQDRNTIGKVRGARENTYTAGVICAKVARYADRTHHPDRLKNPLIRTGAKGSGEFRRASWDEALDRVAEAFLRAEQAHGSEAVWPYFYAGTMGLVQRDGIHRLRHARRYSGQFDTICTNMAWTGFIAGTGRLAGPDPREMARADMVVIWGTNAVSTQVNVMTHAVTARRDRGAKIVAIDIYETETIRQADLGLVLRPGTDGALACAVMHVLFRDGKADWDYLDAYSDRPRELEAHLRDKTPEWAAAITGLRVDDIERFAALAGDTKRSFYRLGYGFTRQRNGAFNMHAALCIPTVTGSWKYEGGGAFHSNGAIYTLDNSMITGADLRDPSIRVLDQSRIGPILEGEPDDLRGGPPVTAMLVQNTNPISVAPEQTRVKRGFAREDLFVAVHEQFMTETARMADVVLPATTFVEHDDIYRGGGHQYIGFGPKLIEPVGESCSNHDVVVALAERLGAEHPGFKMSAREHIDWMLRASGFGSLDELEEKSWIDCQPDFETAHYMNGFNTEDGKFRFSPDWGNFPAPNKAPYGPLGPTAEMPELPDFWNVLENADADHPFRLATSPARSFLNTSFNETPGSLQKEGRPEILVHPEDAAELAIADGDRVTIGNQRGTVTLHARHYGGVQRGVTIAEGIWPNDFFVDGNGINTLVGADSVSPYGGVAFHDNRIWIRRAVG